MICTQVVGTRESDTDLSPRRTANLLAAAVDLGAKRRSYVDAKIAETPRLRSLAAPDCRRKACRRLAALLGDREAWSRDRAARAAVGDRARDHGAAFDAYSALNENLLTVARDAAVELMRAGLRAQHLAPSLFASVSLAAYKEHVAVERGLVAAGVL